MPAPFGESPVLIVFSGLPGVGKTTIARELARAVGAVHVRIDSIEQALRNAGRAVESEGYEVAYAIAEDNLRVGRTVVADCVNPWPLTRDAWHRVADRAGARAVDVEVVCTDAREHQERVGQRVADIEGHAVPAWPDVVARDYRPWTSDRIVIDTAGRDVERCVTAIVTAIAESAR